MIWQFSSYKALDKLPKCMFMHIVWQFISHIGYFNGGDIPAFMIGNCLRTGSVYDWKRVFRS